MSDNKKEIEKQLESGQDSGIKIEFKPSDEKVPVFSVKKTPEQINIENKQVETSPLGINANLGSFGSEQPSITPSATISTSKVATLEKIDEKEVQIVPKPDDKNVKIDFNKFENRKSSKKLTKLGLKFDLWLRQPRTLLMIWLMAIGLILIIWAGNISYLVFTTYILKHSSDYPASTLYHGVGAAANVFNYIAIFLPTIPFFALLTTTVIGINGMLSSKLFHYFLWSFLIAAFVCFFIATILSGYYMDMSYSFHTQPK